MSDTTSAPPIVRGADMPPSPVARYFAAINARAWDDLRQVLAPDVEVRPPGVIARHGVEEAVGYYQPLVEGFDEHVDDPRRYLVCGDSVTVEIAFHGRTVAGHPVAFDAVDVFDLAEGRIARISIWYDTHDVRRQVRGESSP